MVAGHVSQSALKSELDAGRAKAKKSVKRNQLLPLSTSWVNLKPNLRCSGNN